jgi:hypothetical protein
MRLVKHCRADRRVRFPRAERKFAFDGNITGLLQFFPSRKIETYEK